MALTKWLKAATNKTVNMMGSARVVLGFIASPLNVFFEKKITFPLFIFSGVIYDASSALNITIKIVLPLNEGNKAGDTVQLRYSFPWPCLLRHPGAISPGTF